MERAKPYVLSLLFCVLCGGIAVAISNALSVRKLPHGSMSRAPHASVWRQTAQVVTDHQHDRFGAHLRGASLFAPPPVAPPITPAHAADAVRRLPPINPTSGPPNTPRMQRTPRTPPAAVEHRHGSAILQRLPAVSRPFSAEQKKRQRQQQRQRRQEPPVQLPAVEPSNTALSPSHVTDVHSDENDGEFPALAPPIAPDITAVPTDSEPSDKRLARASDVDHNVPDRRRVSLEQDSSEDATTTHPSMHSNSLAAAMRGVGTMVDSARGPQRLPAPDVTPREFEAENARQDVPDVPPRVPATPAWTCVPIPLGPPSVAAGTLARTSLEPLRGQVKAIMDHAESLAARGALYAARSELVQALRAVAQTLDAQQPGRVHEHSLAHALRALRESADFTPAGADVDTVVDLQTIVDGHRTPVLKDENLDNLTCLLAQQRYLAYAQQQLAHACGQVSVAANALYALGRVQAEMSRTAVEAVSLDLPKAMVYYQAALLVDAHNRRAANELGVLLARCGRFREAREVLLHGIGPDCNPVMWRNLAIVHRQLGETLLAQQALQQWRVAEQNTTQRAATVQKTDVRWVEPHQFMAAKPAVGP